MSHEIEANNAFYVALPAWHGLGTVLAQPPTTDEAIKIAGLDTPIDLEPMFLNDGTLLPDVKAVVRRHDRAFYACVGKQFRTVQNVDAFKWFQPFIDAGLVTLEAAGSLRGGRRVWILAKIVGADSIIVPASDDRVTKYLLLAHGHDGSLSIHLGVTPTRVVCNNTLSAAVGENGCIRIRHTRGAADAMKAAREIIERANNQFDKAADIYRALAKINVTAKQIREYIDMVFPPPKVVKPIAAPVAAAVDGASELSSLLSRPMGAVRESVFSAEGGEMTKETRQRIYGEIETLFTQGKGNDLKGVKGTAWALYNGVTDYISHSRGRSNDNRANAAWFGPESVRAIQSANDMFLGGTAAA